MLGGRQDHEALEAVWDLTADTEEATLTKQRLNQGHMDVACKDLIASKKEIADLKEVNKSLVMRLLEKESQMRKHILSKTV